MARSSHGKTGTGDRRQRQSAASRRARGGPARSSDRPPSMRTAFDHVYADARGLAQSLDPLEAEMFASGVVSTWHQDAAIEKEEAAVALAELFAGHIASKRSPDALAFLIAAAAVAPQREAAVLAPAIARLHAAGLPDPAWRNSIGSVRFVEAWRSSDEYGDQDLVMAVFEHGGRPAHGVALLVDHNMGGMAKEVLVTADPAEMRSDWLARAPLPIVPIDAQEAADRFATAIAALDETFMPDLPDDTRYLLPMARSRLRVLPPGIVAERLDVPDAEREALLDGFLASPEAGLIGAIRMSAAGRKPRSRPRSEDTAGQLRMLASYFVDFACDYGAGDPLRWSPIAVELILTDWFPRKVVSDDVAVGAVPDVLRRFVRYAGRLKGLPEGSIADTVAAVGEYEKEYLTAMTDSSRYGPAKSIVAAMQAESVDISDPAAVSAWMEAFNARPLDERDRVLGQLPGFPQMFGGDSEADRLDGSDPHVRARRAFACPVVAGTVRGIDAGALDPADPDERRLLIEAEHADMFASLKGRREIDISGTKVNPKLHVSMHEIVANQLWEGDPPETWEAAQRLLDQGYARHDVLHILAEVASRVTFRALHDGPSMDAEALNAEMRARMTALGRQVPQADRTTRKRRETNAPIPINSRRGQRPPD